MKKYIYTYQTKNLITNKTYIGVHSTNNIKDNYLGSGTYLNKSIKKYGKENFKIEILNFFDNIEDAYIEEAFIVNIDWVNCRNNYNIKVGGFGGFPPRTKETQDKITKSNTGKKRSDQTKEKMRLCPNEGRWKKGVKMGPMSDETKLKLSVANTGKIVTDETKLKLSIVNTGKINGPHSNETKLKISEKLIGNTNNLGNKYSDETKKKMSDKAKGRKMSDETKLKISNTKKGIKND